MKRCLFVLCLALPFFASSQETITVIYYNILNYPNSSNSDPIGNDAARAIDFRLIMEEADADIIVVQELKSLAGATMLRNELNNNSLGKTFAHAPNFFGYGPSFSQLGNMIFYNTNLANLIQQVELPRANNATAPSGNTVISPRANSYYELEVFTPNNPSNTDRLHVFSCHFKSSNGGASGSQIADNDRRVLGARDLMDYINNNFTNSDNIIAGGDFNFYSHLANNTSDPTHDEPAYDELTSAYALDLIDKLGGWTRNDFAPANECKYTQSTRAGGTSDLYGNDGVPGGLDDRFDFILINNALDAGTNKLEYINNSYETFGSPKNLNDDASSSSSPVNTEIKTMSDHYPVIMQLTLSDPNVCSIVNEAFISQGCVGSDYVFDLSFLAGNSSGMYEVVDITNGNTVIGTGNNSPIQVVLPNNTNTTSFDVIIRDANDTNCTSGTLTITPQSCGSNCSINITAVNTTCQANDTYDVEVCFNYQSPASANVTIFVNGTDFGPYAYPANSGDCITIPAASLNAIGDGDALNIVVSDASSSGGAPFISEIHYDNSSIDVNEFLEITGPAGTDLSNYQLFVYEVDGAFDADLILSGIIPDQNNGCGTLVFTPTSLSSQYFENNGETAYALVEISTNTVLEFISYHGVITATNGAASGMTSTDIGVSEGSSTNSTESVQLTDGGWVGPLTASSGALNANLTANCSGGTCSDSTTTTELNCANCVVNRIENGMPMDNGTYQASNNIESAGSVAPSGNVIFDAGDSIDLKNGFSVPLGAVFQAFIGGCTP